MQHSQEQHMRLQSLFQRWDVCGRRRHLHLHLQRGLGGSHLWTEHQRLQPSSMLQRRDLCGRSQLVPVRVRPRFCRTRLQNQHKRVPVFTLCLWSHLRGRDQWFPMHLSTWQNRSPMPRVHRYWEDLPLRWAAVSSRQPLGGGVQQLPLHQRQSGLHQGPVWSSSLPAPVIRPGPETAVLPGWTGVSGAQLLHLLLPPLPSVGGLFYGWTSTSTGNHQVPAKQRPFGQQLRPHNTCFQQRQSTTGNNSGKYLL